MSSQVLVLSLVPLAARADGLRAQKRFMVTVSPMHLLPIPIETDTGDTLVYTVLEAAGELKLAPKLGGAAILGAGRASIESMSGTRGSMTVGELGVQLNYYVVGEYDSRHAVQLGGELLYVYESAPGTGRKPILSTGIVDVGRSAIGNADGLSIGPYAGYKLTTDLGFVFVAQVGIARVVYHGDYTTAMTSDDTDWKPIVNLNVGWSF